MQARSPRSFLLLLIALAAGRSAVANVLVVAPSGPFTQISAAVAAAADGDVILVKPGSYAAFTIANKALDVVADVGGSVDVQGSLTVMNVAATRAVTITGLRIEATSTSSALRVLANAGSIRVQGCTIEGFDVPDCIDAFSNGGNAVDVESSVDVALTACTLHGGDADDFGGYAQGRDGGHGLRAQQSRVALHQCTLAGGAGAKEITTCASPPDCNGYGGVGGHGALLVDAPIAWFSGCSASGGSAGPGLCFASHGGCTGSGLFLSGVPQSNARSLDSAFAEGSGLPVFCLFEHDDVVVRPPDTHTVIAGTARRATATRVVREQAPARVDFFGQPGDLVLLSFAEAGRFAESLGERGVRLVRPPRAAPVQIVGTIGASGALSSAWIVPDLGPGVQSRRFLAQPTFVDASGQRTLGPPLTIVFVDAAF